MRTLETPHIDRPPDGETPVTPSTFEGCAYMWTHKDMPELSSSFQQSIQALQPEAQAKAYTFGEDCIHTDGSVTFLAKETDFNITLQADDLSNDSNLGEWIVKVMQVIENIPQEQIVGPQPGLVTIIFQSNSDQKVINFYINQYQALLSGLSNAEIYQTLQAPQ
jgi:multidrug efflux pump subunit AcrB